MDIIEFCDKVQLALSKKMGTGIEIVRQSVLKNNGVVLHGLNIIESKQKVSPTIYLDNMLEAYENGVTLTSVVEKVMRIYENGKHIENMDMSFYYNYSKVKSRICARIVGSEKNRELLEDVPHIRFMDLAFVFFYAFESRDLDGGSILIHNSHIKTWGVTAEDLMDVAMENTPRIFPGDCRHIFKVLSEMGDPTDPAAFFEEGFDELDYPMFVVTNQQQSYGATVLFYPGMMKKVAGKLKGSYYVLPSSINELIVLKDSGDDPSELLQNMIVDINGSQVEPCEVLTDTLYYYDSRKEELEIVSRGR